MAEVNCDPDGYVTHRECQRIHDLEADAATKATDLLDKRYETRHHDLEKRVEKAEGGISDLTRWRAGIEGRVVGISAVVAFIVGAALLIIGMALRIAA